MRKLVETGGRRRVNRKEAGGLYADRRKLGKDIEGTTQP
jgi:hypothetical protein